MKRSWRYLARLSGSAVLLFASGGCVLLNTTRNAPYQGTRGFLDPAAVTECPAPDNLKLAFLEFDDQGELHDARQLAAIRRELHALSLSDSARNGSPILIVFAHGWRHNAHSRDSNLHNLVALGSTVANAYRFPDEPAFTRPVRLVYLGWRGAGVPKAAKCADQSALVTVLRAPLVIPEMLTFWSRDAGARRVGGVSAAFVLAELYAALPRTVSEDAPRLSGRPSPADALKQDRRPLVLFIGHSMGSLVIEHAVNDAIVTDRAVHKLAWMPRQAPGPAAPAIPPHDRFRPIIILTNSAQDSLVSRQFLNALEGNALNDQNRPFVFAITGERDAATNWIFRLGHGLGRLWGMFDIDGNSRFRKGQFRDKTTAVGHHRELITHRLVIRPKVPEALKGEPPRQDTPFRSNLLGTSLPKAAAATDQPAGDTLLLRTQRGTETAVLQPVKPPDAPYWVIQVDKNAGIIDSHGDVWNKAMIDLVGKLIYYAGTGSASSER